MTATSLARNGRKRDLKELRQAPCQSNTLEALDKSDIAESSATAINNMTCDELVRMIRVAGLPDRLCPNLDKHLPFYDRTVLTRLAHLASRCCRSQGPGSLGKDAE
jgi:hypothetical protein